MATNPTASRVARPGGLTVLAVLAVALAAYYYYTGEAKALPMILVPHLATLPLTLDSVVVGAVHLPVQVNGFAVSLTHDVAGPFTQPVAAAILLGFLAVLLAGWVAVVSTLRRTAFVMSMVPVIFFLMSLNTEELSVFNTGGRASLYVLLGIIAGGGFALHAFAERMPLAWRAAVMGGAVAGVGAFLFSGSVLSGPETALMLAAHATTGGALLVVLVVLWVGVENIRALLWFNTQAERPESRFGLGPFLLACTLYLGTLLLYVANDGTLTLFPGVRLDPFVLLLPAVVAGWLGLRYRAPSYADWVPYARGAVQLYPLLVMGAAASLAYAFATANTPFLEAARDFTALALLLLGGAFLLYVLTNFGPLIRQRLRVYRVVFEPRRLPFYAVYLLAIGGLVVLQVRQGLPWPNQVQAAQYNNLGDLARQQSEEYPDDLGQALLAERYYAESGDVLSRNNRHAQFGRAGLYRFRSQRQNEINTLNRALRHAPDEKASVRLAALYNAPSDLFDGLDVLRTGLKKQPRSAALAGDLAQLFTRTALADSVGFYLDKAERLAPGSYPSQTNQLAFLLQQQLLPAARGLSRTMHGQPDEPALASNLLLLQLQQDSASRKKGKAPEGLTPNAFTAVTELNDATFAQLYHGALAGVVKRSGALLPTLARLHAVPANAAYDEQLVFLQALTRHALGQEVAARQLLGPLTAGDSPTARYYQNLLGLWQLQQGQVGAAATQLARAALVDSSVWIALGRMAQQPTAYRAQAVPMGAAWLAQARQAEQRRDAAGAAKSYQRIVREAPFNESAILAAADFYSRRHDAPAAYEALRVGLDENPQSTPLLKAYVLAAASAGLTEYATAALAELRQQLSPAEYATIAAAYAARQAALSAAAASFSAAPPTTLLP